MDIVSGSLWKVKWIFTIPFVANSDIQIMSKGIYIVMMAMSFLKYSYHNDNNGDLIEFIEYLPFIEIIRSFNIVIIMDE